MNRLEWILGIVLVLLLGIVAVLSLMFWFRQDRNANSTNNASALAQAAREIAPTSVFAGDTSMVAYAQAQQTAVAWQADAQLLNATGNWPQGATVEQIKTGQATWGFSFYSESAQQLAIISVVDETVSIISQTEHTPTTAILEATGWNIDSREAIDILLKAGGSDFIKNETAPTLMMMMTTDNAKGDGRILWQVNLVSVANGRAFKMQIDAASGEILENVTIP